MAKWVYSFGGGKAEGKAKMRDLLGGKGAGVADIPPTHNMRAMSPMPMVARKRPPAV